MTTGKQISKRTQSNLMTFLLITSSWGIISTSLLFYVLWQNEQKEMQATTPAAAAVAEHLITPETKPIILDEKIETGKVISRSAVASLPLNDHMLVKNISVIEKSDNLELSFKLVNATGALSEGYIWATAELVDASGNTTLLKTHTPGNIYSNGRSKDPLQASKFSIRREKERSLILYGAKLDNPRVTKVDFGVYSPGDADQKINTITEFR
jgi:hypothetical protein